MSVAAQAKIAEALGAYRNIDLTIPAQRIIANQVRGEAGLPPLSPLKAARQDRSVHDRVKSAGYEAMHRICVVPLKPELIKAFTEFALGVPRIQGAQESALGPMLPVAAELASGGDAGVSERLLADQSLIELIERRDNQIPLRDKEL